MIGPREFVEITGYIPHQDDIDRANCESAGAPGHRSCGICPKCNRVRFCVCTCQATLAIRAQIGIDTIISRDATKAWLKKLDAAIRLHEGPEWDWTNLGTHDFWHDQFFYEKANPINAYFNFKEKMLTSMS